MARDPLDDSSFSTEELRLIHMIEALERKAVLAGKLTKAVLRYDNPWPPSAANWQGILVLAREFQKAKEE